LSEKRLPFFTFDILIVMKGRRLKEKSVAYIQQFWNKTISFKNVKLLTLVALLLYFSGEITKIDPFSNISLIFFAPFFFLLIKKMDLFFKRIGRMWWFTFLFFQFLLVIKLSGVENKPNFFWIFWVDMFLLLFLFELTYILFLLLRGIVTSRLFKKGKKYCLPAFIVLAVVFFGWQNKQLSKRVRQLEEVVGTNRLLCNEKKSVEEVEKSMVRIIGRGEEGSGFFIDDKGILVTNHHVVARDLHPKVVFPDYSLVQGEVIGADANSDLAIVKVEMGERKIPALEFGDVDTLQAFDELIAIGYALGTTVRGKATTNKGHFVAVRPGNELEINLVQTNIDLVPGMSGGPMIDLCGKVMGINTFSTSGISLALSGNDFVNQKWGYMVNKEDPVAEIEKIEFSPNESPKSCVEAFYNYQTIGDLQNAYNLLSDNYLENESFEEWREGYKDTLYVVLVLVEEDEEEEDSVQVRFYSADLKEEELVMRYFEGKQKVKKIEGNYKLDEADIEEIQEPAWGWFWGF